MLVDTPEAEGVRQGAELMTRVLHGYGNTRGVSKTGNTGTGTVVDFGTPRHTAVSRVFTG